MVSKEVDSEVLGVSLVRIIEDLPRNLHLRSPSCGRPFHKCFPFALPLGLLGSTASQCGRFGTDSVDRED